VSGPNIAVVIAIEVEDVGVVGGDDRPAAIDLCADHQQAPLEQLCCLRAEVFEVPPLLGEPGTPIHLRALEQPPGAAATHLPVKRPYILQAPPRSDPVLQLPLAQGPHLEL